jgi:hypothetical protein
MHMINTAGTPDRRKAERFQVTLRVELPGGKGVTRDLSACGVLFETDRVFAPGEAIQFAIILKHVDPSRPTRLQCQGQVVRVERHGNSRRIAVAITAYRLDAEADGGQEALCPMAH